MDAPSDALLARYLAGECTAAETRTIEHWSAANAANRARLEQARTIWTARRAVPGWDVEGMWARVRRARPSFGRHLGRERPGLRAALAAAAVLMVLAGGSFVLFHGARRAPAMREFATARGQRADMRLGDGTRVVLSVDSKLLVPADYGAATRDVFLHGEAYFEVVHDAAKPFAVHLDRATVRDVGTRFGIRAYAGERGVRVVVAEGRVALQAAALGAGQLGRIDSAGAVTVTDHVNVSRYLAWTDGQLAFDNMTLREAVPELSRWYDLDLTLADPALGDRRLTFEARGEPLTQVLDGIALLVHARYERDGRRVTFHSSEDPR